MTTVTLDDVLQARIQAVAAPEEDFQTLIALAAQEMITRRERQAEAWATAQTEAQAVLNGPHRTFDPEATYQKYQEKYALPDLSHLSGEGLIEDTERRPKTRRPAMSSARAGSMKPTLMPLSCADCLKAQTLPAAG